MEIPAQNLHAMHPPLCTPPFPDHNAVFPGLGPDIISSFSDNDFAHSTIRKEHRSHDGIFIALRFLKGCVGKDTK